jgi:hypothetical protein
MPYEEFVGWLKYFEQRPSGWRDDQRASLLLQAQGIKKRPEELFSSLKAIKKSSLRATGGIDPNFMRKLQSAKGANESGLNWLAVEDTNKNA